MHRGGDPRPERFLHVNAATDIAIVRDWVLTDLFGGTLPSEVGTLSSTTSPVAGLTNLSSVDKITMVAHAARPRVWWPTTANGDLAILIQGHSGTYDDYGYPTGLQALLTDGYAVCGLVMPGGTETASGDTTAHNTDEPPLADFIGPVVIAINTLAGSVSAIHMAGLSGGGWMTVLAAAADTRIAKSYQIAASLPFYMRKGRPDSVGDYEQQLPGMRASYLDMYLLSAIGTGRRHKQILHVADSCCFRQADYDTGRPYAALLAARATALGGDFDLVWRTSAVHEINATIFDEEVMAEL